MKRVCCLLVLVLYGACAAYGGEQCGRLFGGTFDFTGEALYWKPSLVGIDYAANFLDTTIPVEVSTLKASYSWGFRVQGRYESGSGCSFWELGGRYLDFSDRAVRRGLNLFDSFGQLLFGRSVSAQLDIDYWTLDFVWGQYLHRDCCMKFWTFGGLRYADMNTRFSDRSSGSTITNLMGGSGRTKADFRGVGAQVGLGGEHCVWGGIVFFGTMDAAVLASRRTYRQDTTNLSFPGLVSRLRYSRVWGAVPALDARLGAAYTYRCDCWFVRGQIGYEMNYYWNVNKVRVTYTAQPPQTFGTSFQRIDRDLGFGGMFLGLVVGF